MWCLCCTLHKHRWFPPISSSTPWLLTTLKSPPISSFQRASLQDCWLTPSPPMRTAVPRSLRHMAWHHRGLGLPREGRAQACEQSDKTPSAPFPAGENKTPECSERENGKARAPGPFALQGKKTYLPEQYFQLAWGNNCCTWRDLRSKE